MANLQQRPAVGDEARIGTFYNARDDRFLAGNLFREQYPPEALQVSPIQTHNVQLDPGNSYESKFRMLGVEAPLAASILAGWVDCKGAFGLFEEPRSHNDAWSALYHTFLTVEEKLHLSCPALRDCLRNGSLENVTHIVGGVKWGLRSVITAQYPQGLPANGEYLQSQMGDFAAAAENLSSSEDQSDRCMQGLDKPLDLMVYSDVFQANGVIMGDLQEAYGFLRILPPPHKDNNGGKGRPVTYSLLPIEMVAYFFQLHPVA